MAVYKSVTCYTAGDVVTQMKSFLTSNGFSISDASVSGGRTTWNASKGGMTHRFMIVENTSFPIGIGRHAWYTIDGNYSMHVHGFSVGIRAAEFGHEMFFTAGEVPTTVKMDMFILGSADVLFSFEIAVGKWTHIYSGTVGNRIGTWNGGRLFSGSDIPIGSSNSSSGDNFARWVENTHSGLFNSGRWYVNCYSGTSSYNFYGRGTAMLYEGEWNSLPAYSTSDPAGIIRYGGMGTTLFANRSSSAYESNGIKYIAETSTSTYTGIPTLHPIFVLNKYSHHIGSVSEIYMCSGIGFNAGQELYIGAYKYLLYPHSSFSLGNLCIAVRAN